MQATVSATLGVTEPALFGVTVKYPRVMLSGCIAGAIGGALVGAVVGFLLTMLQHKTIRRQLNQ